MAKRLFSIIVSFVMLISCTAFAVEATEESNVVRIGVFSDTHNKADGIANAFNSIYELSENGTALDGVVMNGDIVYLQTDETPSESSYATLLANEKYQELKNAGKLVYEMGNHEFPLNSDDDATLTAQAISTFTEQTGFDTQMHTVLSGYHFINAAPENYAGGMQHAESFMRAELDKALADGTEKPVFLVVHHPVPSSVIDSPAATSTRFSIEFREFLNSQPRIIVFSGHTHEPESDPRSIRQYIGGCTYVQTSHVSGGSNVASSYATEDHSKKVSQAIMMEIEPDANVVTLKRFYVDSENPEYLEAEDWVLDIPAMIAAKESADTSDDLAAYKYTFEDRSEKSVAPYFASESKVVTTNVAAESAEINFPAALQGANGEDNLIKFYEIKVYDTDAAQLKKTDVIISDHFLKEEVRRTSFTHSILELAQGTNYKAEVRAITTWYKKSKPIIVEFQTSEEEKFESVTLQTDSTYTYTVKDHAVVTGTSKKGDDLSYVQVPVSQSDATVDFTFDITNSGMYRIMASKIGSSGAPTKMVITKNGEEGEKTVLKTAEKYISTGGTTTYSYDVPYADVALTKGNYTVTWSRGDTGSTVTFMGIKAGKFAPLSVDALDEYVIEKTAADYSDTSETLEEGTVPENFTLATDGYVSWQVTPDYPGIYKLSYNYTGENATTTVSALDNYNVSLGITGLATLPTNVEVSATGEIEVQLLANIKYNFKFTATSDVTVSGMRLEWQEDFTDLENNSYKLTHSYSATSDDTILNYETSITAGGSIYTGCIMIASGKYVRKSITVPYDANYKISFNYGANAEISGTVYIERHGGGDVVIPTTGATTKKSTYTAFESVPLKAGQTYDITVYNNGSGTWNIYNMYLETNGKYCLDTDGMAMVATDYSAKTSSNSEKTDNRIRMIKNSYVSFNIQPSAGNYRVYMNYAIVDGGATTFTKYIPTYVRMTVNGSYTDHTLNPTSHNVVYTADLGVVRFTGDESTLRLSLPNDKTCYIYLSDVKLVAIDEPEVTVYSETTDAANITTSLKEGTMIVKALLPKDVNEKDVTMFFAIYEDNALYKVETYNVTGKKNTVTSVTLEDIAFEEEKTYTSKVFFWENAGTMIPLYKNPKSGSLSNVTE